VAYPLRSLQRVGPLFVSLFSFLRRVPAFGARFFVFPLQPDHFLLRSCC
jgi:hypothetical protein